MFFLTCVMGKIRSILETFWYDGISGSFLEEQIWSHFPPTCRYCCRKLWSMVLTTSCLIPSIQTLLSAYFYIHQRSGEDLYHGVLQSFDDGVGTFCCTFALVCTWQAIGLDHGWTLKHLGQLAPTHKGILYRALSYTLHQQITCLPHRWVMQAWQM